MEKLGVTAAAGEESSVGDGGRVLTELNQLNQRYMRLIAELHQRLTHIKKVHDDAGLYFPVSFTVYSSAVTTTVIAGTETVQVTPLRTTLASCA